VDLPRSAPHQVLVPLDRRVRTVEQLLELPRPHLVRRHPPEVVAAALSSLERRPVINQMLKVARQMAVNLGSRIRVRS
jgi:pantoate kinase